MAQVRNMTGAWFHPGRAVVQIRIDQTGQIEFGTFPPQGQAFIYGDGDLVLIFSGQGRKGFKSQVPHLFRKIGEGIYRAQDDCQVIVFTEGAPWKTIAGDAFGTGTQLLSKGFVGCISLLWAHPNRPGRVVHLGHDWDSGPKVVYRQSPYHAGTKPHGAWGFHPSVDNFPSAVEPGSLILAVRLHHKGEDEKTQQTLFGRVRGTTNVFIAIGTIVEQIGIRIYQDAEIAAMRDFHIHAIVLGDADEGLKFTQLFPATHTKA
jgi:hypothetical protein